ncbi:MAG: diaminopimelate epimerase [Deltaproteobacteria bacterium]|nr:diaminopimelate epimerase [Deltaproteobacteria bacterium]
MRFAKYHALGNDYLVIRPTDIDGDLQSKTIERICHRHYGIGSDGILLGPLESIACDFKIRIFNPDGSEAEKSGNGLRIFSRFLWDEGLVHESPFTIETPGGPVTCRVEEGGKQVTVEMGVVSFLSTEIPVTGRKREVVREEMTCAGRTFTYCAATVGNPHCVVLCEEPSAELARHYGPPIEKEARFPNRTNVQFMRILDRGNIHIEIWERGAGYTLASGSSATAAAAVAHKLGLCDAAIVVHMPGGSLDITLSDGFAATMRGPVRRICMGVTDSQMFEQ